MPFDNPPDLTPTQPERPMRPSYYSNYSTDKPLPDPTGRRPGTSDTAAELQFNIRRMSEELRQAQKAERLYRARKRVATGRTNRTEAKANFRQSVQHFQLGLRLTWAVIVGMPLYLIEKQKLKLSGDTVASSPSSSPGKKQRKKGKLADKDAAPEKPSAKLG